MRVGGVKEGRREVVDEGKGRSEAKRGSRSYCLGVLV